MSHFQAVLNHSAYLRGIVESVFSSVEQDNRIRPASRHLQLEALEPIQLFLCAEIDWKSGLNKTVFWSNVKWRSVLSGAGISKGILFASWNFLVRY